MLGPYERLNGIYVLDLVKRGHALPFPGGSSRVGGFFGHAFLEIALKHSHDAFYVLGGFRISPSGDYRSSSSPALEDLLLMYARAICLLSPYFRCPVDYPWGRSAHPGLRRSHFALVVVEVLLKVLERVKEGFLGLGERILGFLVRFLVGNFPLGFLREILVEFRIRHLIGSGVSLSSGFFFILNDIPKNIVHLFVDLGRDPEGSHVS